MLRTGILSTEAVLLLTVCAVGASNAESSQPRAVPVFYAWADDAEKSAMARVHLTTEAALTTGCTRVGLVRDDSVKDLRRKIVGAGGNTGVLSFGIDDLSAIQAEVFRCPPTNAPLSIPAPPAGTPPPPPPGPSR